MDASVPQRTANVLEKDVDGELIIVNANTNELVSLSDSGRVRILVVCLPIGWSDPKIRGLLGTSSIVSGSGCWAAG